LGAGVVFTGGTVGEKGRSRRRSGGSRKIKLKMWRKRTGEQLWEKGPRGPDKGGVAGKRRGFDEGGREMVRVNVERSPRAGLRVVPEV